MCPSCQISKQICCCRAGCHSCRRLQSDFCTSLYTCCLCSLDDVDVAAGKPGKKEKKAKKSKKRDDQLLGDVGNFLKKSLSQLTDLDDIGAEAVADAVELGEDLVEDIVEMTGAKKNAFEDPNKPVGVSWLCSSLALWLIGSRGFLLLNRFPCSESTHAPRKS